MKFKLKDPGSAITHGIALLLAVTGAIPLIIKAARDSHCCIEHFYTDYDPALCSQYHLSLHRFY